MSSFLKEPDGSTVLLVESASGDATAVADMIADRVPVARARGAQATRSRVGGLADELGLDELTEGTIVIEEAQWADPTSLGRLQRLVTDPERHLVVVIAHRPLAGVDGWGIERFLEAAERRRISVQRIVAPDRDEDRPSLPEDLPGADLVVGAVLAGQAISVPVSARLLGLTEPEALAIAERLVSEGALRETRTGFSCVRPYKVGEARAGFVAARLASALEETGGSPSVIGQLRLQAGDPGGAFDPLAAAVAEAEEHLALAEAYPLAEAALEAAEQAGRREDAKVGHLHLVCARFLRLAGRSDWALSHIDQAMAMLEGAERIDAIGFAAALADDRQHPQQAERLLAFGEWEANRMGESAKLGSLTSFRARALHRIGFPAEADAMTGKAAAILDSEKYSRQRYFASVNRAWIMFDRGEAARAEAEFSTLRHHAGEYEGEGSVADMTAWWARALFASGNPEQGLEAVFTAEEIADRLDVQGPVFLSELALAEGNLDYGRYEEALAAADRVLDLVERQLPAWQNVARFNRASALHHLGRLNEAMSEIESALDATPDGADGWRWRVRCRALQIEIAAAAGQPWPAREAHDLADLMLQSSLKGWAAELMCAIAEQGRRGERETAEVAMALASRIGNPMLAARAAAAGNLWTQPEAQPVVRSIHHLQARIPESWDDEWKALKHVRQALETQMSDDDGEVPAESVTLDRALRTAGLAGMDVVLSPAQRRSRGLVRRRRILRPIQIAAAAVLVVGLAGGTAWAVSMFATGDEAPAQTVVVEVTQPEPELTLEETQISPPTERVSGNSFYRGDYGRSGFVAASGAREVDGYYWRFQTAGPVNAAPVAYGINLLVGSTDGTLYALSQTDGSEQWRLDTGGDISTAPGLGRVELGEGQSSMLAIVGNDSGTVRARDAITVGRAEHWQPPPTLGSQIRSSPVVFEDVVALATHDPGVVYGIGLDTGELRWTYPDPEAPDSPPSLGLISAALAMDDNGVIYAGTESGELHLIHAATGEGICVFDTNDAITVNPIVVDGVVYVPTMGRTIYTLPAGACAGNLPNRFPLYTTEESVEVAPAIVGDVMYLPDRRVLYKIDLRLDRDGQDMWPPSTVIPDAQITAAPVVANDTVYFGSADGVVHAVDAEDGTSLWTWQTGNAVIGPPAVVDGVVFIASRDGWVHAVGPEVAAP